MPKPDGTIICAEDAKASNRNAQRKAASGIDYYEVLGVSD